ncbi:hypothetical protein HY495_01150 [Candidatus Woesearchaeota archaeon]|nr:hypothetical protein [Candidatus Woesearchaeota archaeon]
MSLKTFICVGIDHIIDPVQFIADAIDYYQPMFVTLEVPLNTNSFPCFPRSYNAQDCTHEWSRVARMLIENGRKYYCIDGSVDRNAYPWFSDVEAAATLAFPDTIGSWGSYRIEYGARQYSLLGGKWHLLPQLTDEYTFAGIADRNRFAAAVIHKITGGRRRSSLLHVGGLAHFQTRPGIVESPLQDLVKALEYIFLDATQKSAK